MIPALTGWVPSRLNWDAGGPYLEWCRTDGQPLVDPFYSFSIRRLMSLPFNLLFRHRTSLDVLPSFRDDIPGGEPAGFIFHISRCGSTLVGRALGAVDGGGLISEPEPLSLLLDLFALNPDLDEGLKIALLRGMAGALGQADAQASRLFFKMEPWDAHELALLRLAFPRTPWLFLTRNPVQVMASLERILGGRMLPGVVPPSRLRMTLTDLLELDALSYSAKALGHVLGAMQNAFSIDGEGLLLDYAELPQALWTRLPEHFGIELSDAELSRMRGVAEENAKRPDEPFRTNGRAGAGGASPLAKELAERYLEVAYSRLMGIVI